MKVNPIVTACLVSQAMTGSNTAAVRVLEKDKNWKIEVTDEVDGVITLVVNPKTGFVTATHCVEKGKCSPRLVEVHYCIKGKICIY